MRDLVGVTASFYDFIVDSEAPLSTRHATLEAARTRVIEGAQNLMAAFAEVRDRAATPIIQRVDEAMVTLRELAAELRANHPAPERLRRLWHGLGTSYEALRAHVGNESARKKDAVALAALKPKNLTRAAFHVTMALVGVLAYELFLDRVGAVIVTGTLLSLFVALEVLRRRSTTWNDRFTNRIFKGIIRPGEVHRIPASTWYIAALFIGCVAFPQEAIQVGALVLGLGDPTANIVGRRFGRLKLVGDKSLVGTLAFVGAGALAVFLFMTIVGMAPAQAAVLAVVGAVAGAAAELFSGPLDDNFTIPLVAGLAALAVL